MARNYEKRFTGLNRFVEAKQREENKEKNAKRPPLHRLRSAEEVKKWIPSINREINYLLLQISGPHESRQYQDHKIEEFKVQVEELKREHQRFVAKVRELDPSYKNIIPWQPRGYQRKRPQNIQTEPLKKGPSILDKLSENVQSDLEDKTDLPLPQSTTISPPPPPSDTNSSTSRVNNPLHLDYSSSDSSSDTESCHQHKEKKLKLS